MSAYKDLKDLLVTHLAPTKVFFDVVPEEAPLPAVAVTQVSNDRFGRVLSGRKTGKSNVFRVSIVSESILDQDTIIDLLEELDNTISTEFQRIWVELINREAKDDDETIRRAFVDITVYL